MAYVSCNNLWESGFDNFVSEKDKVQDLYINHLKLQVHDSYIELEKTTTIFEASNPEDVINKAYLDEKLLKIDGHLSLLEEDDNEIELLSNKQSIEEVLIEKAVKTTLQILYDKGLLDGLPNVDEVLKDFLFFTRSRPDLEKVNVDIQ